MIPKTTRPDDARTYELRIIRTGYGRPTVELTLETVEDPAKLASALRDLAEQIDPTPSSESVPARPRFQAAKISEDVGIVDHELRLFADFGRTERIYLDGYVAELNAGSDPDSWIWEPDDLGYYERAEVIA